MKKIRWEKIENRRFVASVGLIRLMCVRREWEADKWVCFVNFLGIRKSSLCTESDKSLSKTQENGIQTACELLTDMHDVLVETMDDFGINIDR